MPGRRHLQQFGSRPHHFGRRSLKRWHKGTASSQTLTWAQWRWPVYTAEFSGRRPSFTARLRTPGQTASRAIRPGPEVHRNIKMINCDDCQNCAPTLWFYGLLSIMGHFPELRGVSRIELRLTKWPFFKLVQMLSFYLFIYFTPLLAVAVRRPYQLCNDKPVLL